VFAGVVLWMTTRPERAEPIQMERSQGAAENGATRESPESRPKVRPTKAEAKNILRGLQELVLEATRKRDLPTLSRALAPEGTSFEPASKSIRRLLRDNVLDKTRFRSTDVRVLKVGTERIRVEEERRLLPCFVTEQGVDVTQGPPAVRQVTIWSLHRFGQEWLIESAEVKKQQLLGRSTRDCP
ncbi:MAG: hypothetical protein M3360_07005, partial [Actinomycetota bacterium]|nr:hypothetical protein [Actinomycetota bacterium]